MIIGVVAAASMVVVALVLTTVGASQNPAELGQGGLRECKPSERNEVLREEQGKVLARVGGLTELRDQSDVAALARRNYAFLAHQFTSFRGIGLTVINPFDTVRAGVPNLLFYAPSKDADDVTDPRGPDFPYTLVGWGYGLPYEPGRIPALIPCVGIHDWHIHERGVHPIDSGGMTPMPPAETRYGEARGSFGDLPVLEPEIGFPHPRSWTVHFWLDGDAVPTSAILDPDDPPAGIDPGIGSSFFFPEEPLQGSTVAAQASTARPYVLRPGGGRRVDIRGSTYTFKAGDQGSAGAFAVFEIVLRRGSEPPQHIHHREVEAFYVLEGEMTFHVNGQLLPARAGSFVFLPRGVAHGYTVDGNGVARLLLIATPGGLERFFDRLGALGEELPSYQESLSFGVEPVGPPPGAGR